MTDKPVSDGIYVYQKDIFVHGTVEFVDHAVGLALRRHAVGPLGRKPLYPK